jgi:hypothetical protein
MLGRVMSVDFALCTLFTSVSAFVVGALEDETSLSPQDVCIIMAFVGFLIFVAWGIYYLCTNGFIALSEKEKTNGVEKILL